LYILFFFKKRRKIEEKEYGPNSPDFAQDVESVYAKQRKEKGPLDSKVLSQTRAKSGPFGPDL
jgi:hypothetical protein